MAVAGFAVLEEYVAVLGHTAGYGSVGGKGAGTEVGESLAVEQGKEVFLFEDLNFLNFVRGAEAVEEVYKRNACLNGGEVSHTGEVHNFLYGAFSEHGEAGLTNRHHVLVVTEDRKSVRGECTRRHVEYGGQKLACDFVHVGNHQQETLRSRVGGGEGTGLK